MRTMDRVTSVSTGTGQSRLELESKKPDGLDRAVVARGALLLSLTSFFILRGRGLPARRGV